MTDRKAPHDPPEPPDDVASLYSWANLHGVKYRDFSASRAQLRERTRQSAQQGSEEETMGPNRQTERHQAEDPRREEGIAGAQAHHDPRGARQFAQRPAEPAAADAGNPGSPGAGERDPAAPPEPPRFPAYTAPQFEGPARPGRLGQDTPAPLGRGIRTPLESREAHARPAWIIERPESAVPATSSQPPGDSIQDSRDRLTSRWYALKGVFDQEGRVEEPAPAAAVAVSWVPSLAVFSLAGGVGKTSLVATLGRALSARGERVLLVDTAAFGLLPFFFGARDQRPGQLRTFGPPGSSGDAPIQMVTLDPEGMVLDKEGHDSLSGEISRHARGAGRILIDLGTASGATTRRILRLSPQILVPVVPDMNSVVSVSSIDSFFERNMAASGKNSLPHYVLNQFDASLPLHLDVREVLREQLGERLLPFALRRVSAVSEALAEGMTVMDYAPNSAVAEDFGSLAAWVKSQSAPAHGSFRGVRWSER